MAAVPRLDDEKRKFTQIPGTVPHPARKPSGCYFHPLPVCNGKVQERNAAAAELDGNREVRCHYPLTAGGESHE